MSHKHSLAAKCRFKMPASEVASFEVNFFRVAGTSEAESSVSGKAKVMFTCYRQRQIK